MYCKSMTFLSGKTCTNQRQIVLSQNFFLLSTKLFPPQKFHYQWHVYECVHILEREGSKCSLQKKMMVTSWLQPASLHRTNSSLRNPFTALSKKNSPADMTEESFVVAVSTLVARIINLRTVSLILRFPIIITITVWVKVPHFGADLNEDKDLC